MDADGSSGRANGGDFALRREFHQTASLFFCARTRRAKLADGKGSRIAISPNFRDYDFFAELEHFDANRVKLAYAPTLRVGLSVHLTAKEGCYILHVEKGKANGKT